MALSRLDDRDLLAELLERTRDAQPPETACATVMQALVGSGPGRDDIALLMVRRPPGHAGGNADAPSSTPASR